MKLGKENGIILGLCVFAGLLWVAGSRYKPAPLPAPRPKRPAPARFEFPPSDDQTRRENMPSGFERPLEPPAAATTRSTLSVHELHILDRGGNVVLKLATANGASGLWMGRPHSSATVEAVVQRNGYPVLRLSAGAESGALRVAAEDASGMPNLLFGSGSRDRIGLGLSPTRQGEAPFLDYLGADDEKIELLSGGS